MRIETAEKMLKEEYERAKKLEYVRDPVAWALYQVWKKADAEPKGRKKVLTNAEAGV